MHTSRLLIPASLLLLAACSGASTGSATLDQKLKNPLYAKHYYEDLVGQMVTLEINNDPILKTAKKVVDDTRIDGTKLAQNAVDTSSNNPHGSFISDKHLVQGSALAIGSTLYLGSDFQSTPGPSLHIYLTSAVDPRVVQFPDTTAVDLGTLQDPYGAQQFSIPEQKTGAPELRTVVLWDNAIGMAYGFVQLGK